MLTEILSATPDLQQSIDNRPQNRLDLHLTQIIFGCRLNDRVGIKVGKAMLKIAAISLGFFLPSLLFETLRERQFGESSATNSSIDLVVK